ncbi:MAG: RDD family protein [Deltaproteobacteria bacterium]|nr:RDD family protein [Deltaproteobacteria bacterium]
MEALLRERDWAAQAALQAQAIRVYADPPPRAAAFLIDMALLALTALICFVAGIGLVSREMLTGPQGLSAQVVRLMVVPYALLLLVFMLGYFTYFHGTSGQTLGKILLGLRVVRAHGDPLGLDLAFLRAVGYLLSALLLGGGFLWALFDTDHQGLHDKLAGSYVVRTRG